MSDYIYTPHANQIAIHENTAKYRVVVAGRRFGKSALGLNEGISRVLTLPRQVVWILLPKYKQAKEIYWVDPDITKYFDPYVQQGIMKKNEQELSLYVHKTKSWLRLKGADNYESLRGSGLDLIIWDEVADVKEKAFETIEPSLADSPNHRVLYIGTPKGLNHFHDFALRGDHQRRLPTFEKEIKADEGWQTWHFTSYDNAAWPEGSFERKEFVKYIDKKKAEAEEKGRLAFFNQEYMASFEESAGRFFPAWSYQSHVIQKIEIPHIEIPRYGSMDWGRAAPFAWYAHALIRENYHGIKFNRIITFRERYAAGSTPWEHAQEISGKDKMGKVKIIPYKTVLETYCDPKMNSKGDDGAVSIIKQFEYAFEYIEGEIPQMIAANNDRVAGWSAMDNWMRKAPDGMPYWLITQDCPNLIRTIPEMVPDDNNIEDMDTTKEDHAVDSCRYFLIHAPWIDAYDVGGVNYDALPAPALPRIPQTKDGTLVGVNLDDFADAVDEPDGDWRAS